MLLTMGGGTVCFWDCLNVHTFNCRDRADRRVAGWADGWAEEWVVGWAEEWVVGRVCKSCRAKLYKVQDFDKQIWI